MNDAGTMFAPGDRADLLSVRHDAEGLRRSEIAESAIDRLTVFVTVLNRQRQIVYANQPLLDFLGASSPQAVLGKRPGEALGCVHASECVCGCGTTEFCRECGAVKAILESQMKRVAAAEECRITTAAGRAYDLRVWASPYASGGREYTLFSVMDIGHEKRRLALEHTFLHDANNLLAVLVGSCECLRFSHHPQKVDKSVHDITVIAQEFAAEVHSYGTLVKAEEGRLVPDCDDAVESSALLDELMQVVNAMWPGRSVLRAQVSDDFTLKTDRAILFRVLYNMVKNAVEAARAGETVSVGCKRDNSSGVFSVHNPGFMPRSIQLQVFQRSFSTKGRGRGLGTYSMKLFGEGCLKGKVWFVTSEVSGTTFSISLPLSC